jgi:hypothetical protein
MKAGGRNPGSIWAALGLASTLALAACTPSGTDMTSPASASAALARQEDAPAHRRNPQPKQAYRITMTIENAPGPFASMTALAQFDVVNKECLRPPKDNPGGHTSPVPTEDVEIPLQKVSDNTYSGMVYADQMLEDYNGRGICHWKLMQFRVHMKATGAEGETLFIPSIPDDKLLSGQPETVYFNKIGYPRSGSDNFPDTGLNDRGRFGPSIPDEDLFTVRFTSSKEAAP